MKVNPISEDVALKAVGSYSSKEIVDGLKRLPISTWRYDEEEGQPLHIGPMAQDFAAVFGLGSNDKEIAAVDAFGVLLVAVKALAKRVDELESQVSN